MTNFEEDYISLLKEIDGLWVIIQVVLIDEDNHPLGKIGAMMMGPNYSRSSDAARQAFNKLDPLGNDSRILVQGKIQISNDKIRLINPGVSEITLFRPSPPMNIEGIDMSYWWSYDDLENDVGNSFPIRTFQVIVRNSNGDGFTVFSVHK